MHDCVLRSDAETVVKWLAQYMDTDLQKLLNSSQFLEDVHIQTFLHQVRAYYVGQGAGSECGRCGW